MTSDDLGLPDFARLFGTEAARIPADCRALIEAGDFRYRRLAPDELADLEVSIGNEIASGRFSVAGKEGKTRWEKGWGENLQGLLDSGGDVTRLVPRYIRAAQPVRLDQTYVWPDDPNFELNWYAIFRRWLFHTYLAEFAHIYEFGCGSGFNLVELARLYPDKTLVGLDWAAPSRDIVNTLATTHGFNMQGRLFDFFAPDRSLEIAPRSAVLTIGALEQTGRDHEEFLRYLLDAKPALCVHVEPICEWYDKRVTSDRLAIQFHRQRKYWEGFPDRLRQLEAEGRVQVLKAKRSFFGSLYLEGYSQLVWTPVPGSR